MRWLWLSVGFVAAASGVAWWLCAQPDRPPNDAVQFKRWLAADKARRTEFAAFARFLRREKVAGIVPARTLLRGDSARQFLCPHQPFLVPPRSDWRHIVPVLKLVRDQVQPVVGAVDVVSANRTAALNRCAGGASRSRHLSFAAVDLVARKPIAAKALFSQLCSAWRKAGLRSGWGLGAYFDPSGLLNNREARFHVDASGWRSWGYSYKAASSGCVVLHRDSEPSID